MDVVVENLGSLKRKVTEIAAASALGIYQHGGFGIAHFLAVLTILAVLVGGVAEKTQWFGGSSPYIQAASYSATFLFHMMPAITDGLTRLPAGSLHLEAEISGLVGILGEHLAQTLQLADFLAVWN